ncbi:MAG: hypothetical protein AAB383_04410 [Patescibacteria group bacterium]
MKSCINCQSSFTIRPEDEVFYGRMDVPAPTHCPACRAQRRWAFRNQYNLYKRTCDFSGKEMLSLYSPDKPLKVYEESVWWSDAWDPLDYGRDYDFSRPFFDQYKELFWAVPRHAMHQDGTNENCDYITYGGGNKSCYLAFACIYSEDIYFSSFLLFCKDSLDSTRCIESSLLYECVDCEKSYECFFCKDCISCQDSLFLDDCRNCKNCIGCKNLRNKEYHIFNEPVSKEEFERVKAEILKDGGRSFKEKFDAWRLTQPYVYARINNSENCVGNYLENAHNSYHSFDLVMGADDCNYCINAGWKGKDMWDCTMTGKEAELLYEMHATVNTQHSAFCSFIRSCSDIYYCDSMDAAQNCFGSIGLRHKQYCILNKQYSKEAYEALLPRIIEHMKATGEWGEFPPIWLSPFAYNETLANEHFPLTKEAALAKGYTWKDEAVTAVEGGCKSCGRAYKVIPQEKAFYGRMGLPEPENCWKCRHERRFRSRNPYRLWKRNCHKCQKEIETSYSPERPEIVYCETCYLADVY